MTIFYYLAHWFPGYVYICETCSNNCEISRNISTLYQDKPYIQMLLLWKNKHKNPPSYDASKPSVDMMRNRNTVYRNGSMNWRQNLEIFCWILIFTNNIFSIASLTAADGQIYLLYELYGQPLFHTMLYLRRKLNKNNRNIGISSSLHLDLHHVYGKHTSIYTPISVKITPTSALYMRCQQYIHYPYLISSIKSVSVSYRGKYVSLVRMGSFYAKQGRRKSWFAKQFLRSITFSTAILPKATL